LVAGVVPSSVKRTSLVAPVMVITTVALVNTPPRGEMIGAGTGVLSAVCALGISAATRTACHSAAAARSRQTFLEAIS